MAAVGQDGTWTVNGGRSVRASRTIRRRGRGRNQRGSHLVETLVALLVGAMIAFSLTSLLSQTMRHSSATQNELMANQMAFSLLDFLKKRDFKELYDLQGGSYDLLINRDTMGQIATGPRSDPTILDFVNQMWSQETRSNKFNGAAKLNFEAGPIDRSVRLIVAIYWSDSQNANTRTIVASTVVTESGAQDWRQ